MGMAVSLGSHSTVAGVLAGAVVGILVAAGIALRTWWRGFRKEPGVDVDPWALPDPWRQLVAQAVGAERRFRTAASSMPPGPLLDRVVEMEPTLHAQVLQVWDAARQGAALTGGFPAGARTEPSGALATELRSIQEERARRKQAGGDTVELGGAEAAVAARLREARRAEAVAGEILNGLRSAVARLEAAVTALAQLASDSAAQPGFEAARASMESVSADLSALRSGLEEVAGVLPATGSLAPEDPPGR